MICNNTFKTVSLLLFFLNWTNLINSNVIHNHIFIYYRDNYKCNIYNFSRNKIKTIQSKTPRNLSKKLIKLNKMTIQNKKKKGKNKRLL